MDEEIVFIKMVNLKAHHNTGEIIIRDKILNDYIGENLIVKVFRKVKNDRL